MFDADFAWDLIDSFSTGPYVGTRTQTSGVHNGREVPGKKTKFTVDIACVQPAGGRDLLRLPEERRATETRVMFTKTPLQVGGQGAALEADRITLEDGKLWEIQSVESWMGYTKALLQVPS
jgi:hypothetical protein